MELISKTTRYEFREYLARNSVLRRIEIAFDGAYIAKKETGVDCGSERRNLIEKYYASLNFADPNDIRKLLTAFETVLIEAEIGAPDSFEALCRCLDRDGYKFENGRITLTSQIKGIEFVKSLALEVDSEQLKQQIRRIEESIDQDPALAIGSAKELVETCCKSILLRRGVSADIDEFPKLTKSTFKELNLVPDEIPDSVRGAESIKRMLSNLAAVAHGLTEIRNLYGTGHGRDLKVRGLKPRHARLAVGAAVSLAVFLIDTDSEQRGGQLMEKCPHCDGAGSGGVFEYSCPYCDGRGEVPVAMASKYGTAMAPYKICPVCSGNSADADGISCGRCGALGLVSQ